ncbi:enoyl-CoA hydratase [Sphingomonas hankyongi]|uniref:enoyl-CoA hydratase n=1 Tax=Sphingomonas hankyongi TaxID=2908209 RepID=UPI0024C13E4A|nr:enoyl-CoA hydratase [Sphingomonas hankyongi]
MTHANALIRAEQRGPILRLTLQNPPANALSLALMEFLQSELDAVRSDETIRVIVIAADGKLFSAGHDLKQMTSHRGDADHGKAYFEDVFAVCSRLMQSIVDHPKPVIAEVDGLAAAAGCQLVASCDLAFASERSRFAVNGLDIGLFCTTPAVALTRIVNRKQAMEMLLTGDAIDAVTAKEIGLLNRVVPTESLTSVVTECASLIATKSALAVKLGKAAVQKQSAMGLAEAYQHASRTMVENMLSHDAAEGIAAFLDKRKPTEPSNDRPGETRDIPD